MEPILICADSIEADKGRIYYISADNRRHWIPSPEVAGSYGWDLGNAVKIPINEVMNYPLSFSITKKFDNVDITHCLPRCQVQNKIYKIEIYGREWFGSQFKGSGLELGGELITVALQSGL